MAKIKAVPDFNGYRANVLFKNGVGETNDEYLIDWFKKHGYEVMEDEKSVGRRLERKPKVGE